MKPDNAVTVYDATILVRCYDIVRPPSGVHFGLYYALVLLDLGFLLGEAHTASCKGKERSPGRDRLEYVILHGALRLLGKQV